MKKAIALAALMSITALTANAVIISNGSPAHNTWEAKGTGIPSGYIIPDTGGNGYTYTGEKANGGSYYAPHGDGISNFPWDDTWYVDEDEVDVNHGGRLSGQDKFGQYGVGDNWYVDLTGLIDCNRSRVNTKVLQETCSATIRQGFNPNRVNMSRYIIDPLLITHGSNHQRAINIQYREAGHTGQPVSFLEEGQWLTRRVSDNPVPSTVLDANSVGLDVIEDTRIINSNACWVAHVNEGTETFDEYQCLATMYSTLRAAGEDELVVRNVTAVYRVTVEASSSEPSAPNNQGPIKNP